MGKEKQLSFPCSHNYLWKFLWSSDDYWVRFQNCPQIVTKFFNLFCHLNSKFGNDRYKIKRLRILYYKMDDICDGYKCWLFYLTWCPCIPPVLHCCHQPPTHLYKYHGHLCYYWQCFQNMGHNIFVLWNGRECMRKEKIFVKYYL